MSAFWRPHRARLLDTIVRLELWRRLSGLHVRGSMQWDTHAVNIIVANHTGRYDGFAIWRKRFAMQKTGRHFTVMLQAQVDKHRVFQGAGAVGFQPDNLPSLRRVARFMENDVRQGDTVVMFPQGRILPGDALPLRFKQLPRLAARCPHRLQLTAIGLATEMLHEAKPAVFMDIGAPVDVQPGQDLVAISEEHVTARVKNIRHLLHELGEQAVTHFSNN